MKYKVKPVTNVKKVISHKRVKPVKRKFSHIKTLYPFKELNVGQGFFLEDVKPLGVMTYYNAVLYPKYFISYLVEYGGKKGRMFERVE